MNERTIRRYSRLRLEILRKFGPNLQLRPMIRKVHGNDFLTGDGQKDATQTDARKKSALKYTLSTAQTIMKLERILKDKIDMLLNYWRETRN